MEKIITNLITIKDGIKRNLTIYEEDSNITIQNLLEDGFIVIQDEYIKFVSNNVIEYNENYKNLKIYIPEKINQSSMTISYEIISDLEQNEKFQEKYIYNYHDDDYDYFDEKDSHIVRILDDKLDILYKSQDSELKDIIDNIRSGIDKELNEEKIVNIINNKRKISSIFLYFTKEKLNLLTEKEKEMMNNYRIFDLEKLLIGNESIKYPLNNDSAGCISIFEDEIFSSNCTKMQHGEETKYHFRKKGINLEDAFESNILVNVIKIQIYENTMIIYTAEDLNNYQKEQLLSILENVKRIEESHNIKFMVSLDKLEDKTTDVEDSIKFIKELNTKVK